MSREATAHEDTGWREHCGAEPGHQPPWRVRLQATYLHEEQAHDEGAALAVTHFPVHQRVRLHRNTHASGQAWPRRAHVGSAPAAPGLTFMTLKRTSWPRLSWPLKNSCSG